nr:alpha/beta fold hydrolase [Pseudomonas gingeri]
MRNRLLVAVCLLMSFTLAQAAERWETLPPTPTPVVGAKTGYAAVNGIKLYYTRTGHGSPVVLLHGGLGNSDYWGNQVKALAAKHTVISIDSRGHGRSSRDAQPYG